MIEKHNLQFDLGLHSYTLAMNRFGDMVNRQRKNIFFSIFCSKTNEEFRKQMNGLKIDSNSNTKSNHLFSAPKNFVLPDRIGNFVYFFVDFILIFGKQTGVQRVM